MIRVGDTSIELGQPIIPGAASWRYVERFGPGIHSIALQVADLDATVAHLAERGVAFASRPAPYFGFSDPRATDGILFEWFAGTLDDDPRHGAPVPPSTPALLDVQRYAFTGVVVPEPRRTAERIAALLDTALTFEDAGAGDGRSEAGVSTRDTTIALYRLPPAERSHALWGRAYDRPRTHLTALRVPDLDEAGRALGGAGIALVRRDDTVLLPRPEQTGHLQVAITDRLLPNDPRS